MKLNGETKKKPRKPESAGVEERRYKAFELRKAGANYRTIAATLRTLPAGSGISVPPKYDHSQAYKDVEWVLNEIKPYFEDVDQYRRIQIERRENLLMRIQARVQAGHLDAIETAIKIDQRIAVLKGTDQIKAPDAPQTVNFIWTCSELEKKKK